MWLGLTSELPRKEALKDVLRDLYQGDAEATRVLDAMTAGSEHVIRDIPLADRTKTGRADTQYGTVIIEFEKDLRAHLSEALRGIDGLLAWA